MIKIILLVSLLLSLLYSQKIAIIGSGIGGASLTHYLTETFENINITVFEKSNRIGGRTHTVDIQDGQLHELGAHFIIDDNLYVKNLVKEYGLHLIEEPEQRLGIFKDKEFKFLSESNKFYTLFKMIKRYGFSFLKFMWNQSSELKQFLKIYEYLDKEKDNTFTDLDQFLKIVGQYQNFNKTGQEIYLNNLGASQLFSEEFLDSIISNFYNQNYDVNGFAGMISAAGLQGNPRLVKEGFNAVSTKIFEKIKTNMKLNTEVTHIDYNSINQKYILKYKKTNGEDYYEKFDIVVICSPLEVAKINFDGKLNIKEENRAPTPIFKFSVAATHLNPKVFGLENESEIPEVILTPDRIFGKISIFHKKCTDCYTNKEGKKMNIYVWTCVEAMKDSEMDELFPQGYKVVLKHKREWPYPKLKDTRNKPLPQIILNEGLYYQNSMEFLAACTELQAIAAKNIVNLMREREGKNWELRKKSSKKGDL